MDQCPQSPYRLSQQSTKITLQLVKWIGITWAMGGLLFPQLIMPAVAQSELVPDAPEPMLEPVAPLPAADPIPEPVAPVPVTAPAEPPPSNFIEPTVPAPAPEVQIPKPVDIYSDTHSDPYIDTRDFGTGATSPTYGIPEAIGTGVSPGCQSIRYARPDLDICNPAPIQKTLAQPPSDRFIQQKQSAPHLSSRAETLTSPSSRVTTGFPQSYASSLRSYRLPYKITPLDKRVNPLKWLQPNGQRMLFPLSIPAAITSAFGWRLHPISGTQRFHSGTDIGAPTGTPVLAAYAGKVLLADWLGGYGLSVLLEHNKGKSATRYAHLSEVFVKPGQVVKQGTVIGFVGSTGNSTGPHLHFETLQATEDGFVAVDPGVSLKIGLAHLINALQTARLNPTP